MSIFSPPGTLNFAKNKLAYFNSEHLDNVEAAYNQEMEARDLRPTDPAIADSLGWINYERGDYLFALSLIQESVSKFSQNPEIQYHLGKTHAALNNDNEAEEAFSKALEFGLDGEANNSDSSPPTGKRAGGRSAFVDCGLQAYYTAR